jgi:hypothetical protein
VTRVRRLRRLLARVKKNPRKARDSPTPLRAAVDVRWSGTRFRRHWALNRRSTSAPAGGPANLITRRMRRATCGPLVSASARPRDVRRATKHGLFCAYRCRALRDQLHTAGTRSGVLGRVWCADDSNRSRRQRPSGVAYEGTLPERNKKGGCEPGRDRPADAGSRSGCAPGGPSGQCGRACAGGRAAARAGELELYALPTLHTALADPSTPSGGTGIRHRAARRRVSARQIWRTTRSHTRCTRLLFRQRRRTSLIAPTRRPRPSRVCVHRSGRAARSRRSDRP